MESRKRKNCLFIYQVQILSNKTQPPEVKFADLGQLSSSGFPNIPLHSAGTVVQMRRASDFPHHFSVSEVKERLPSDTRPCRSGA